VEPKANVGAGVDVGAPKPVPNDILVFYLSNRTLIRTLAYVICSRTDDTRGLQHGRLHVRSHGREIQRCVENLRSASMRAYGLFESFYYTS